MTRIHRVLLFGQIAIVILGSVLWFAATMGGPAWGRLLAGMIWALFTLGWDVVAGANDGRLVSGPASLGVGLIVATAVCLLYDLTGPAYTWVQLAILAGSVLAVVTTTVVLDIFGRPAGVDKG